MNQIINAPNLHVGNSSRQNPIKVSVIVPIYNPGARIYRCLDTLINQTLREIEIICVLDCPTDGTDKVVEEYARKDDRIIVIHNQRNLHVAASRNEGLMVARGEYIGFSDADDYRELNMYERLLEKARCDDAEVVVSDAKLNNEDGSVGFLRIVHCSKSAMINACLLPFNDGNVNRLFNSVCCSIYKRSFLLDFHLTFLDNRVYLGEDALFNLTAAIYLNRVSHVQDIFYCWDKHDDSLSNKVYKHEEVAVRMLNFLSYASMLLMENGCFNDYKEAFYISLSYNINRYYWQYKVLPSNERDKLVSLIKRTKFPLFGRYSLQLFSKKRVKLFFFVLKLKWEGRNV